MSISSEEGALPAPGRVKEVTREWLVRTDEELAHRLQDEEISAHLVGNRSRNEQIREDFPAAAAAQKKVEESAKRRLRLLRRQAEEDAQVARELHTLQQMEIQKTKSAHVTPQDIILQERRYLQEVSRPLSEHTASSHFAGLDTNGNARPVYHRNNTCPTESTSEMHPGRSLAAGRSGSLQEIEQALGVALEDLQLEQNRLLQEELDAEMARKLGTKEDPTEVRDGELARLLQNRELERFRKMKEKHRSRKQAAQQNANNEGGIQVNDTYSQPCDFIPEPRKSSEHGKPKMKEPAPLPQEDTDPYYMEPFQNRDDHYSELPEERRGLRAPPMPPRLTCRPRLAEPDDPNNTASRSSRGHSQNYPEEIDRRVFNSGQHMGQGSLLRQAEDQMENPAQFVEKRQTTGKHEGKNVRGDGRQKSGHGCRQQ